MQRSILYGIIAAVVVAAGVGVAFAAMSMNGSTVTDTASTNSSDNTRVIKHVMGETEITGTPERIVALEWSASENLLAMGIQPVGVADLERMKEMLRPEGLPSDIAEVGTVEEPNFETISELEPDLIIGEKMSSSPHYDQLSTIAPTVIYDNAPPLDGSPTHLESLEQNIIMVAEAANKRDQGVEIVDRLHAKYEEAARKIEAAGLGDQKYVAGAADPALESGLPALRFFDNTFFMSQILSRIGLENAVTEEYGLAEWGMNEVGLEGLATVDGPGVHLFYIHSEGQDLFKTEWKDNPVWTNLEIAKNGNMHPVGPLYVYGGPKQMEEFVDKAVQTLTNQSGTRTISHDMGETEINGIPKRIVALEWTYAEDLVTLGVQPIGVADTEGMKKWVNLKDLELSENVTDVGQRGSPNLETIAKIQPDLIIGTDYNDKPIYDRLNEIAPTLLLSPYPKQAENTGQLERMQQEFMEMADIVGRHDQGVAVLNRLNQTFEEASRTLAQTNVSDNKFVVAAGYTFEDSTFLRLYTDNGIAVEILEGMGLENAWDVDYAQYAYSDVGLENLAKVEDANFFYIAQNDDDIFKTTYKDNPVWKNLRFVQEGRVYPIGGDTWVAGGPISAELIAEKIVAAVIER